MVIFKPFDIAKVSETKKLEFRMSKASKVFAILGEDESSSVIECLKVCDECIVERTPYPMDELIGRVMAQLKQPRVSSFDEHHEDVLYIFCRGLMLIPVYSLVIHYNQLIPTTALQFRLLMYFITNSNQILTKEQIYTAVWHNERAEYINRVVINQVNKLRRTLIHATGKKNWIQTVRDEGYRFVTLTSYFDAFKHYQ